MSAIKSSKNNLLTWCAAVAAITLVLATAVPWYAAVPGISSNPAGAGSSIFNLTAGATYISQPDGAQIWSWGYGCSTGSTPTFVPARSELCPIAQIPGPTMIVAEKRQTVSVTLTNGLPAGAGNTSILFPDSRSAQRWRGPGLQTQEAGRRAGLASTVRRASETAPGTYSYYSGAHVLSCRLRWGCTVHLIRCCRTSTSLTQRGGGEMRQGARAVVACGQRLPRIQQACYDREYLFQFSELDATHSRRQGREQSDACATSTTCAPIAGCD